jgi:hypothetical protein
MFKLKINEILNPYAIEKSNKCSVSMVSITWFSSISLKY